MKVKTLFFLIVCGFEMLQSNAQIQDQPYLQEIKTDIKLPESADKNVIRLFLKLNEII